MCSSVLQLFIATRRQLWWSTWDQYNTSNNMSEQGRCLHSRESQTFRWRYTALHNVLQFTLYDTWIATLNSGWVWGVKFVARQDYFAAYIGLLRCLCCYWKPQASGHEPWASTPSSRSLSPIQSGWRCQTYRFSLPIMPNELKNAFIVLTISYRST